MDRPVSANDDLFTHVVQVLAPNPYALYSPEAQNLLLILAGHPPRELVDFAASLGWTSVYFIAAEWDYVPGRTDLGRGDLVLSNKPVADSIQYGRDAAHEAREVLVVELKRLSQDTGPNQCGARRKARRMVEKQVGDSVAAWKRAFPKDMVRDGVFCVFEGAKCTVAPPP